MENVLRYFPDLTALQQEQMAMLGGLYAEWNGKINVISRQDVDNLYERHVLHSLALARYVALHLDWAAGTTVIDVGTGGGFPGIPLAVVYPDVHFLLVDRTGKKIRVVQTIAQAIGLHNVEARQASVEDVGEVSDYAVSRAAMSLPDLLKASRRAYRRGLLCLKGGDLTDEIRGVAARGIVVDDVSTYFDEPFFATKRIVYVPRA